MAAAPGLIPVLLLVTTPGNPATPRGETSKACKPINLAVMLPGAADSDLILPQLEKDTPQAERESAVRRAYPELTTLPDVDPFPADAVPLTPADLRQLTVSHSPLLRRAAADADAAFGQVMQAGLFPNPTVGYQNDLVEPGLHMPAGPTCGGSGKQHEYVNRLIVSAGNLPHAQQAAGFDYVDALVEVRKAEADVATAVRTRYVAVLVARRSAEVNRELVAIADEVYLLQLGRVAAGRAAAYEPLQAYAQAEQARNGVLQAEAAARAAWRQLAAAVGRPDLQPAPLAGSVDAPPPTFDAEQLRARVVVQHTDVLTRRNALARTRAGLTPQRRSAAPGLGTNQYREYDNAARTCQFGAPLGLRLLLAGRDEGNIHAAAPRIGCVSADLEAVQNDLAGHVTQAYARYESDRAAATQYRDLIVPNMTRAYRAMVRQHQVEPEKVRFRDVATAQQRLTQASRSYLTAVEGQWRAVVDLANLGQLDELFPAALPPSPGG